MSDKKSQEKDKKKAQTEQLSLLTQSNNPNQYLDNLDRIIRSKKGNKLLRRGK